MARSASDIVVKPIQAFRPNTPDTGKGSGGREIDTSVVSKRESDEDTFGRAAGLDLPSETQTSGKKPQNNALVAMKGSASGVGGFLGRYSKGMLLDLPYAVTEGMRNAPKLYGGEVYNPGAVTDWKSGGIAAGKNFAHGIVEGIGGIVMEPVRGAKTEGAAGAAKGVGIGLLNFGAKVSSGTLGLVALPGQGIYQSARTLVKRKTGKSIMEARKAEGKYCVERTDSVEFQRYRAAVIEAFEGS
jgi:hypothetical protein